MTTQTWNPDPLLIKKEKKHSTLAYVSVVVNVTEDWEERKEEKEI